MWFAALDGLVVGALVALAVLAWFRRDGVGAPVDTVALGALGGLVGGLLGFALLSASRTSGPLQLTPVLAGVVGALVVLAVRRGWVLGDRRAAVAAVAAEHAAAAARAVERRRSDRRVAREPSKLAELVVVALVARRWRS